MVFISSFLLSRTLIVFIFVKIVEIKPTLAVS